MSKKIFAILISVVLGLCSVEILLKIFSPLNFSGYYGNYEYDEDIGAILKEGYFSKSTDYKQEIIVNSLRTINPFDDFENYKYLAFALGDSFTQGMGASLSSNYPSFLDLINNNPNEEYQKNVGIVNLGLSSNGGLQNLLLYKRYKDKLGTPDFLLYLGCDNDYYDDIRFKAGYKHKQLVSGSPYYGLALEPMKFASNSEIIKRLKILRRSIINNNLGLNERDNKSNKFNKKCVTKAEKSIKVLDRLKNLSEKDNFELIISWVTDPTFDQSCNSYDWVKSWAKENNIKFADYLPRIKSIKKQWINMPIYNDHSGGHFRTWVNFVIADTFSKAINSSLLGK